MEITNDYSELMDYAISILNQRNVNYGDVRYTKHLELKLIARDSRIAEITRSSETGIGIRVQSEKGAPLAFVSTSNVSQESLRHIIDEAYQSSLTLSHLSSNGSTHLADQPLITRNLVHTSKDSIFTSDITDVKDYALSHVNEIKENDVSSASCGLAGIISYKHIMTTEGTDATFLVDGVGYKGDATIRKMGQFQTYADRKGGTFGLKDLYSLLDDGNLAQEIGKTVSMMVKGKPIDSGQFDVIIDPAFAGLLAHESFGHMTEADAVTTRASALTDRLGERLAPDFVSIVDDPTYNHGAWNFLDDEGVIGKRNIILNKGILENYMSDRRNAYKLDTASTGNSRASDYGYPPIVRMTNTCFLPHDHSLDEMVEDVKDGLFLKGHAGGESGTTGKFSFRSQVGFLIKNGEIGSVISSVTLNGNILDYLKKIDAVGREFSLEVDCGFGGCGKGGQRALVGLGGTYIRFRDVSVTSISKPKMPMMGMMK